MKDGIVIVTEEWEIITEQDVCLDDDFAGNKNDEEIIQYKKNIINGLKRTAGKEKNPDILGLSLYNGDLRVSYVGVSSIKIDNIDEDVIIYSQPHMGVNPYMMLNSILDDSEYDKYLEDDKEPLFVFFDHKKLVPASNEQSVDFSGDFFLAVSFIKACEMVCKKELKTKMSNCEENLYGKIKGKVLFSNQIKYNISVGREDRVYCRYQEFSVDTAENRVLKAALLKAKKMIDNSKIYVEEKLPSLRRSIRYCTTILEHVKTVPLSNELFYGLKPTGMYSHYKKAIYLAKIIHKKGSLNAVYSDNNNGMILQYALNMPKLFEAYVRKVLRKQIDLFYCGEGLRLEEYDTKFRYLCKNIDNVHIAKNYIPDIILKKETDVDYLEQKRESTLGVYDVKYKKYYKPDDDDSHQLISYAMMFDTDECGFIMPVPSVDKKDEKDKWDKIIMDKNNLSMDTGELVIRGPFDIKTERNILLKYYEIFVSTNVDGE